MYGLTFQRTYTRTENNKVAFSPLLILGFLVAVNRHKTPILNSWELSASSSFNYTILPTLPSNSISSSSPPFIFLFT